MVLSVKIRRSTPVPVILPDTEVDSIQSSETGRSYDIYVHFPGSYAQHPEKKYPVVYLLDAQWDFKLLDAVYNGLVYDGFVPEMLIVGITYSGANPDHVGLRAMDYTPIIDASIPGSGNAPKFHAFLKNELIPFVEANYRAEPSRRMLMGASYGGSFALYALFAEPKLFNAYAAISADIPYGNRAVFQQEADYAKKHPDLPAHLFLSVAELEETARPAQEFMQVIARRGYTGLKLDTRTIPGERHAGNKPEAFNRGLRFIFQEP